MVSSVKPRVWIPMNSGRVGGAERVTLKVIDWLIEQGVLIGVYMPAEDEGYWRQRGLVPGRVTVKAYDERISGRGEGVWSAVRSRVRFFEGFRKVIRSTDVIYSPFWQTHPMCVAISRATSARSILHLHDMPRRRFIARGMGLMAPHRAVAVSGAVERAWRDVGISSRVVYNAIARDVPLPTGEPCIVCVGAIHPVKGQRELIEAVGKSSAAGGWAVKLIGDVLDVEYARSIERAAKGFRIEMPGGVEDPWSAVPQGSIAVVPSMYPDPCPAVLGEAMCCGLPQVAFAVGGIPEVLRDGVDGLLVRPGDVGGLAESLDQLLSAPVLRLAFGASARERAHDLFCEERFFAEMEAVFRTVSL